MNGTTGKTATATPLVIPPAWEDLPGSKEQHGATRGTRSSTKMEARTRAKTRSTERSERGAKALLALAAVLCALVTVCPMLFFARSAMAQASSGGIVVAWGQNYDGQSDVPLGLPGATDVAAGAYHSLALLEDGFVVAWGSNSSGQSDVPFDLQDVTDVAAGKAHSLALKSDGTVVAWGADWSGQSSVPGGLSNVKAVAAGGDYSLALKRDGTVVAWGYDGSLTSDMPTGLSGVTAIAVGGGHSLAVKQDGTVVAWGSNGSGRSDVPSGLSDVTAVAAGEAHSLALKRDGTVVAWGSNKSPFAEPGNQSVVPSGLSGVVDIAAGGYHSLAVKSDGALVSWGSSVNDLTTGAESLRDVRAVAGGWHHSVALVVPTPPGPVGSLEARAGKKQVSLSWQNPADADFWATRVLRSTVGPATGPEVEPDQTPIYDGPGESFTDTGLEGGTTYHYTVYARDDLGTWSEKTTVSATTPVNRVPTANNDSYAVDEDGMLTVAAPGVLTGDTDPDGDILSATPASGPAHGTLDLRPDGSFVYAPDADYNGDDSFTYKAGDDDSASAAATVRIEVRPVNDAPRFTAGPDQTVDEDSGPHTVPGWATGVSPGPPNEAAQTVSFRATAANESLFSAGPEVSPTGDLTFTPAPGVSGDTSVTVVLEDDGGTPEDNSDDASKTASFGIKISAVNDVPTARDDSYTVAEDTPLVVRAPGLLANDTDPDGDALTSVVAGDASHGALDLLPNGFFLYIPGKDFDGQDSFTYAADDGAARSAPATVRITVTPVAEPPAPEPPNTAPAITGLSPTPGSKLRDRTPAIRATVSDAQTDLTKADIRLWVDGRPVERFSYDRATNRLSFVPKRRMEPGRHTVLIVARDGMGLSANRFWAFGVQRAR